MNTCPNGHSTSATDYCDVCGAPMTPPAASASTGSSSSASAAAPDPAVATTPLVCPNCSFPAAPDALFCENCGYDFTTGSLPEPAAEPAAVTGTAPIASVSVDPASSDPVSSGTAAPAALPDPGSTAPPPAGEDTWVAEVWIDPEWYAEQQAEDPLPSGGLPGIVVLRQRTVLVGRNSPSRGIHPQIDCGTDSGVSRRQCQLNTDGKRWWVEDLQSSNGTFLSPAGEAIPTTPITPGQRREIADGDRIFVGAWTRIVIRKALPGEA